MANRWGNNGNSERLFSWTPESLQMVHHKIKRHFLLGRKSMTNLNCILKNRDITLVMSGHLVMMDKGPSSQSYGFSSSHV